MCHLRPQTSVFALAFPLAGVNADERLVLASPSSFTPGQLLQVFSRSGTRYRYVLAIAAVGENAPIRKLAWLTSILWMMSNRGPSTWMTYLPSGPLVTVVVWAPAFVLAGGEDIRKVAFPLIWIGWSRNQKIDQLKKKMPLHCGPKWVQQNLSFHNTIQNTRRMSNSICYVNSCHELAFVPDAFQVLSLILTGTWKLKCCYL